MDEKERVEYINNKCPNCGSDLAFVAGTKKLKCESCGSEFDIDSLGTGRLDKEEKSYLKAVAELNYNPRVSKEKVIHCKDCGANFDIGNRTISTTCPYCGSFKTAIEDKDDILAIDGVIPFTITKEKAKSIFTSWIKKKIFAPRAMRQTKADQFIGFYLPLYTFDSDTYSSYTADRGDYYYTTRTERTSDGRTVEVKERHTSWTHVSGSYDKSFNDIVVRGTDNKFNKFIDKSKNYNLDYMEKYQEKFLLGYNAERASNSLTDGFSLAKREMDSVIRSRIRSKIGGDEISNLKISTSYRNITYKNILVPIYCGSFKYKKKEYDFIVNGQTGKFAGKYPKSAIKIISFVLIIVIIILLLIFGLRNI